MHAHAQCRTRRHTHTYTRQLDAVTPFFPRTHTRTPTRTHARTRAHTHHCTHARTHTHAHTRRGRWACAVGGCVQHGPRPRAGRPGQRGPGIGQMHQEAGGSWATSGRGCDGGPPAQVQWGPSPSRPGTGRTGAPARDGRRASTAAPQAGPSQEQPTGRSRSLSCAQQPPRPRIPATRDVALQPAPYLLVNRYGSLPPLVAALVPMASQHQGYGQDPAADPPPAARDAALGGGVAGGALGAPQRMQAGVAAATWPGSVCEL